jgi:hypothetical protein
MSTTYVPVYAPDLFIRNVGNVSANLITRVIEELGFGTVRKVDFRGNNAVAYINWDLPNTTATRIILQEGTRPISLYYDDNRYWEVTSFKTRQERDHDLCKSHDNRRRIEEQERQERQEQKKQKEQKEQMPPAKPEESWIARTVRLAKEKAEAEKQNIDPKQKEYDALRTTLTDIHANALKQRKEEAPMLIKQRQDMIEAHKHEDARLEALRIEKEEIERQIAELLEQERLEEERQKQQEQQARLQQEMIDELAEHLNMIELAQCEADENVSEYIDEDLVCSIDYGNVAQYYPATNSIIRARFDVKSI